jgi:ketol-acid reductoisomerase
MSVTLYTQEDVEPDRLNGRKIAVLGYGSQGHAHALNLRDAGHDVIVAQREGGPNHGRAMNDGFRPVPVSKAAQEADILICALPDERMGQIYDDELEPNMRPGQTLGFVHGFSIRFQQIKPPESVDVILVAPKGPGQLLRERFRLGGGLTCLVGVHQDASGHALQTALAWACAVGGGRGGMIETTFAAECESDLFGEQAVLCGGVVELVKTAFDILVEAGHPAEVAYFECVHELKQITDLIYDKGLAAMRQQISNTAAYGGLTRGPCVIGENVRREMKAIFEQIRSGVFANEWILECKRGMPKLKALSNTEAAHPAETAGRLVIQLASKGLPPGG